MCEKVNLRPALMYFFPSDKFPRGSAPEVGRELTNKSGPGSAGPDGKKGQIWSHFPNCALHFREDQVWHKMAGGHYIGHWKGYTPEDFARKKQFVGYEVELTDGNAWEIAIANPMYDTSGLPFVEVRGDDGQWTKEVKQQYRDLADTALDIAEKFRLSLADQELVFGSDEEDGEEIVRSIFCDVIGLNYDLLPEEIEALRLLDPKTYMAVLGAYVDWPTMQVFIANSLEELAGTTRNPTDAPGGSSIPSGATEK